MTFNILNRREVEKGRYYWDYCSSVEVRLIILCLNWLCGITLTGKVNWNQAYPPFWSACCRMSCTVLGWTKPYCVPLRKKNIYISLHCRNKVKMYTVVFSAKNVHTIPYLLWTAKYTANKAAKQGGAGGREQLAQSHTSMITTACW